MSVTQVPLTRSGLFFSVGADSTLVWVAMERKRTLRQEFLNELQDLIPTGSAWHDWNGQFFSGHHREWHGQREPALGLEA